MTWTEQITLNAMTTLDVKQVTSMFYRMSHAVPQSGLTDIALLRNHGSNNSYCIRLTWHSEIPETGRSSLGLRLAKVFSEKAQTHHTVWSRETSVFIELERLVVNLFDQERAAGGLYTCAAVGFQF